jgi:cytochrome bd-type quinol oxidase subunit 1
MSAPVETKVKAASGAALVAGFIVGVIVLKVPGLSGLSEILQAAIVSVITTTATAVAGWCAKHTPRQPEPLDAG